MTLNRQNSNFAHEKELFISEHRRHFQGVVPSGLPSHFLPFSCSLSSCLLVNPLLPRSGGSLRPNKQLIMSVSSAPFESSLSVTNLRAKKIIRGNHQPEPGGKVFLLRRLSHTLSLFYCNYDRNVFSQIQSV